MLLAYCSTDGVVSCYSRTCIQFNSPKISDYPVGIYDAWHALAWSCVRICPDTGVLSDSRWQICTRWLCFFYRKSMVGYNSIWDAAVAPCWTVANVVTKYQVAATTAAALTLHRCCCCCSCRLFFPTSKINPDPRKIHCCGKQAAFCPSKEHVCLGHACMYVHKGYR